ncbi:MAG: ATP-binding cassette domain-containing protein, partial [Proteobacteria bacterium]
MDTLLDIRKLSVDFHTPRGRVKALRDVTFGVPRNRIVGVVGESGSGKSTVLWSILGLLSANAEIAGGQILFGERDLLALAPEAHRAVRGEEISVVFQDPMTSQIPVLTYGRQMLDILYRRRNMTVAEKRRLAVELMTKVGIPDPAARIDQYPHHFSGGMRQRAGIAMALLTSPALLLADEPTTALDVTMEAQIIHLLQELQRELNATIVMVSHNLGLIAELCDDVVVMYAGVVVETGTVQDIFHRARHPYTRALLECDPARITRSSRKLPVIPGDIPDLVVPPPGCVFAPRCQRAMTVCHRSTPPEVLAQSGGRAMCHLLEGPDMDPSWPPPREVVTVGDYPDEEPAPTEKTAPSTASLLDVSGLDVRFRTMGGVRAKLRGVKEPFVNAVVGVSISVRPGETVGLVGESGSGKTTLGRTILNLVEA